VSTIHTQCRLISCATLPGLRMPQTRDSLPEQGGFEPPVPRGLLWAEFSASLAHYSARQKASVPERICSPGIRLCSGCLRFASFARLKADARRCETLESFRFKSERLSGVARRNFCPSSSQPHHVAAATAMKNSVGDSRISARVGDAPAPPAPERTHMSSPCPIISIFSLQARNSVPMP
jgi:hypothetical protein